MTKINPEKTGRKQTQGLLGTGLSKHSQSAPPSPLPTTSLNVLCSFSLPLAGLPAALTSPSSTPTSYEGRMPQSQLCGAHVLSWILPHGPMRLGGGHAARGSWSPLCSQEEQGTATSPRGLSEGEGP